MRSKGTLYLDRYGNIAFEDDGSRTAHLVNFRPGSLELLLSVSAPTATAVHPTADGGLFVVDDDGILRTYGSDGTLVGVVETGVVNPRAIAVAGERTPRRRGDRRRDRRPGHRAGRHAPPSARRVEPRVRERGRVAGHRQC